MSRPKTDLMDGLDLENAIGRALLYSHRGHYLLLAIRTSPGLVNEEDRKKLWTHAWYALDEFRQAADQAQKVMKCFEK